MGRFLSSLIYTDIADFIPLIINQRLSASNNLQNLTKMFIIIKYGQEESI